MKRFLIYSIFSLFVSQFSAQNLQFAIQDTLIYNRIELNTAALYGSNSLQNEFLYKFLYGGYISKEIKDNSLKKHDELNRAGAIIQAEASFSNLKTDFFGNKKFGYKIQAGTFYGASSVYPKDLYLLTFYGNQQFGDSEIDLSSSEINYFGFTKVGLGIIDKKSKSSIVFNLYSITDYARGFLISGKIVQSDSISELSILLDGRFQKSQKSNFNNGVGAGFDLDYRFNIDWLKNKKATIQLQVKNIGLGLVYDVDRYDIDSNYQFNGLDFDQVFGDNSIFDSTFVLNDTLNIRESQKNRWVALPVYFQAGKIINSNYDQKLQSFFGIGLYPTFSYVPKIYVGTQYTFGKHWQMGGQLSYGGFNQAQAGLYSNFHIGKFQLGLGTENVLGFSKTLAYGNSFNFRLLCDL